MRNTPGQMIARRDGRGGFTLIEIAIAITIVGLMLAAGSEAYSTYLKRQAQVTTKTNVALVASSIANYLSANGRYPCPASLTATRGDNRYGHESTVAPADCTSTTLPPGVYTRTSNRSPAVVYESAGVNLPPEEPVVRVGAVPFRELNLEEDQALDGYGNRIVYAVTERLATKPSYRPDGGGIDVQGAPGVSLLSSPSAAHFFIYSAGKDMAGAYSRYGIQVSNCPASFPQSLNCSHAPADFAAFSVVQTVTKQGAGYFDDVTSYFTQTNTPLWEKSPNDVTSIREKPDGKVGIFHPNDMSGTFKTIIPGKTRTNGNILAESMCDSSGDCFPSSVITGTYPTTGGLGCPSGQYVVRVDHNKATCANEIWADCDSGKVLRGISGTSAGQLICDTPPPQCPSQKVTLCTTDSTLPVGSEGQVVTVYAPYARKIYTCKSGSWTPGSPLALTGNKPGICDCTAALTANPPYATQTACDAGYGTGSSKYTTTFTFSCTANGYTSTNDKPASCKCNPDYVRLGNANCKPVPPYSGTYPTTQAGACVNNVFVFGAIVPATQPPSCVCKASSAITHPACTAGLTGTRTIQTDYACPSGTQTVTDLTKPGDCTCKPTSSSTFKACPDGYVPNPNGVQMTAYFTCPSGPNSPGVWASPVQTGSDCVPTPVKQCIWAMFGGIPGQTVRLGAPVGTTCPCGTQGKCSSQQGSSSYTNDPACVCQ